MTGWDEEDDLEPTSPKRMSPEERLEHLDALAARGGTLGSMAKELIEVRREREAKAEAERLASEAEATLEEGQVDWRDPRFIDGLRASVLAQRAATDAAHVEGIRRLRETQYGKETADTMMADEAAWATQVAAWTGGSDRLLEHPAYREHLREQAEAVRAREVALRGRVGYHEDLEAAEAYIAAAKAKALSGAT
jgi:hypothetical protein